MRSGRSWAALTCAATLLVGSPALAQSRDASQRALKVAYEADDLYARGRWAVAYDRFAEADGLAHSPVFVLYMARCRKNAGRLLDARLIFERLAGEKLAAEAPKPFRDAVTSAAAERDEVSRRIPVAAIVVTDAPDGRASIRVDGKEVSGAEIPLDPGMHAFEASSGAQTARRDVLLTDGGGHVKIVLSLAGATTAASPAERPAAPERSAGSAVPAIVALSIGAAGLGMGAFTGLVAANKASAIKSNCVDGHCLRSDAGALSSARTMATVSTVGFVVAGVGLAAGGVLLVVRSGGGSTTATARITPTSFSVDGTF
jgi:hypothetical protein